MYRCIEPNHAHIGSALAYFYLNYGFNGTVVKEEYVSIIIGLYKNNGSVRDVAIRFLLIYPLYPANTQAVLV